MSLRLIVALPNPGSSGAPRGLFYADTPEGRAQAEEFSKREDRPGWGVFDCVGGFHPDAGVEEFQEVLRMNGIPLSC
jgi:hypothetical protein